MELVEFIRFFADTRASRILMEKKISSGYFDQYPDRKEMFEQSDKNEINEFMEKNPEAIGILNSIASKANESMERATEAGNNDVAESDKFILDDINYILDNSSVKESDISIEIDDNTYQIIKLITEARCCALYGGVLEGAKHIKSLLKDTPPEVIRKSLEIASKADNCAFPKRNIADSLDLEIFKAGLRDPKVSSDGPEER